MSIRSQSKTLLGRTLPGWLALLALLAPDLRAAPAVDAVPAPVELGLTVDLPLADEAVLQRDLPIGVSGRAAAGSRVEVRFDGQVASGIADESGRWQVSLRPRTASALPQSMSIEASLDGRAQSLSFSDLVIGDVWVAAGLEDMARTLAEGGVLRPEASESRSRVRLFVAEPAASLDDVVWTPAERRRVRHGYLRGAWHSLTSVDPDRASALAWNLARHLGSDSSVPVGVVQLSTGPSTLDSWLPRPRLLANDVLAPRLVDWWSEPSVAAHVRGRARRNLAGAFDAAESVSDAGQHPFQPGFLWQHAVVPLEHLAFAGVVWASGSFALEAPAEHEYLLVSLIESWRERLGRPELPFVLVESTNADLLADPSGEFAALRRDAERRLCSDAALPAVELVVTRDLALQAGGSAARARVTSARAAVFIEALLSDRVGLHLRGPRPTSIRVNPSAREARVSFERGAGLRASDGSAVRDVWIVGANGTARVAEARIEDGELVASHPAVRFPVEVRYGWGPAWEGNLVNAHGLPAPTFRLQLSTSAVAGGR